MTLVVNWLCDRKTALDTNRSVSIGLLIMRLFLGLTMAFGHGWGKLTNFSEVATQFPDPFGIGLGLTLGLVVFAEFFCSLALALGVATRAAVIPLIIAMGTAAFVIHADDPFATKEKALLYLVSYVAILIAGPGRYALDALCCNSNTKKRASH
jgi:putative oxidoreductase